jgi:iron complex transport system ATP-binding protein
MVMELRNVGLNRNGKQVLNAISGEIKSGKIIALLGPNGAGKSTLIQTMAGLLASDGEIKINGQSIKNIRQEELSQQLAYLPQHSQLQFPLLVEEVLSLATLPFKLTKLQQRQKIKSLINQWDMGDLAEKDFRQLSGGEQQRCQIARTYLQLSNMTESKSSSGSGLWLLDEPTSSLDLEHQKQLEKVCQKAVSEGHSVVIVLHNLNQAMSLADEIWLLENGEVVAQGPTKDVMKEALISRVFKVTARRIEDNGDSFFVFS